MFIFKSFIVPGLLLISTSAFSQLISPPAPTTLEKFPYGNGIVGKWGVPLEVPNTDVSLRLGARFQSLATIETVTDTDTNDKSTSQDFQARRVRFQIEAKVGNKASFYMDVRNDNANQEDGGERNFSVGDAFVTFPLYKDASHAVRLFRAKVDVARTETISSSELIFVNRPYIADEAAQFISHNRRASNIQIVGNFFKKVSYQFVVGDGVYSDKFFDAKGKAIESIEKQNFMLGGKVRISPIPGWEDAKVTETYFGEGKHFSFGAGAFNTSNIRILNASNNNGTVSRNLLNLETSAHYRNFSVVAEYFKLEGVIENHATTGSFNKGTGEGWYTQGEYVFTNFYYLAPFARFEKWNRFLESGDYETDSNIYGVNWYLNGNRFRVSAAYEKNNLGRDISGGKQEEEKFHIASMWHF